MSNLAFLFPGQGSQYIGMGKELCENHAIAREVFDEANEALGFDLKELCFNGNLEVLTKTENTQPAILTASVAAFKVFGMEFAIKPKYMAGHSLGEFSALACAGAIRFQDAVRIVRQRGKFMQEAVPVGLGAMAAVSGVDKEVIEEECRKCSDDSGIVVVSNYNSPEQIVISGHSQAVGVVGENLKRSGARVIPLKVSAPFHSPLMQQAAERLEAELRKYTYSPMNCAVISNVTALPYDGQHSITDNLVSQIVKPVRWSESMKYLESHNVDLAVEFGPQTVLKNLMKKNTPTINAFSFDKEEDVKVLREKLLSEGGAESDNKNMKSRLIGRCLAIAVCTKNNNWDNEQYNKGVVEPYKRVREMLETLEREGADPSVEQMREALKMLKSVFDTKGTSQNEQIQRFNQLFEETGLGSMFMDMDLPA